MSPGAERDMINNQKRIIRELKRIADALENMAGTSGKKSIADYISTSPAVIPVDPEEYK